MKLNIDLNEDLYYPDHMHFKRNTVAFKRIVVSQKEKIQQAMEKRALDKILKRLVNHDFTW
jgi:hypothetical protein